MYSIPTETSVVDFLLHLKKSEAGDLLLSLLTSDASLRDTELKEESEKLFQQLKSREKGVLRGGIGFFLFAAAAEHSAIDTARSKATSEYLKDEDVREYIQSSYEISDPSILANLKFHRNGTTSYILRTGKRALKLIKPRHRSNPFIASATRSYEATYGGIDTRFAPAIHESKAGYILMDFVEGDTLREAIYGELRTLAGRGDCIEVMSVCASIWGSICTALEELSKDGIAHLDLSPDNIILTRSEFGRSVKLIDFGENYILREKVGTIDAFSHLQRYIAPERRGATEGNTAELGRHLADVYALGVILLEMLSPTQSPSTGIETLLDRAWQASPDAARLAETMIEGEPKERLSQFDSGPEMFQHGREEVREAATILEKGYAHPKEGLLGWLMEPYLIFRAQWRSLKVEWKQDGANLHWWLVIPKCLHVLTIVSFLRFLLLEPEIRDLPLVSWISVLADWGSLHLIHVSDHGTSSRFSVLGFELHESGIVRNLPGMLVAISFSFIAERYYGRIFSGITVRNTSWFCELLLRSTAVLPWLPILWAIYIEPQNWPLCSAVGVLLVSANNFSTFKLAERALETIKRRFRLPLTGMLDEFLESYRGWWSIMLVYGAFLLFLSIFLPGGGLGAVYSSVLKAPVFPRAVPLNDEWMYAITVVVAINFLKIYVYNCGTSEAMKIRGGLVRLYSGLLRARRRKRARHNPNGDDL